MKIVEHIVSRLGISLRALASFTNTSHTVLSRYEAATRSLPTTVMLPLAELQNILAALPAPPLASPSAEDTAILQQRAAYCTAQATILQQQLSAMQLQYTQATTLLQLIDALRTNPVLTSDKQQRWLDEQQYQANKKLEKYGWLAQQQLQHKIALLQHEASLCLQVQAC
jgi:transcriptional regulator with XRE-family HTH domain